VAISEADAANRSPIISTGAKKYALGLLVVVYTFNFIDRQILAILLPAIKTEFMVDDRVLGFLAGPAFAVMYATLSDCNCAGDLERHDGTFRAGR
jgi:hypothetical protein